MKVSVSALASAAALVGGLAVQCAQAAPMLAHPVAAAARAWIPAGHGLNRGARLPARVPLVAPRVPLHSSRTSLRKPTATAAWSDAPAPEADSEEPQETLSKWDLRTLTIHNHANENALLAAKMVSGRNFKLDTPSLAFEVPIFIGNSVEVVVVEVVRLAGRTLITVAPKAFTTEYELAEDAELTRPNKVSYPDFGQRKMWNLPAPTHIVNLADFGILHTAAVAYLKTVGNAPHLGGGSRRDNPAKSRSIFVRNAATILESIHNSAAKTSFIEIMVYSENWAAKLAATYLAAELSLQHDLRDVPNKDALTIFSMFIEKPAGEGDWLKVNNQLILPATTLPSQRARTFSSVVIRMDIGELMQTIRGDMSGDKYREYLDALYGVYHGPSQAARAAEYATQVPAYSEARKAHREALADAEQRRPAPGPLDRLADGVGLGAAVPLSGHFNVEFLREEPAVMGPVHDETAEIARAAKAVKNAARDESAARWEAAKVAAKAAKTAREQARADARREQFRAEQAAKAAAEQERLDRMQAILDQHSKRVQEEADKKSKDKPQ